MKVLVVDDFPANLKYIARAIRGSKSPDGKSFDVTEISNYEEALKCVDKQFFDVVVVDMWLGQHKSGGIDIINHLVGKSSVVIVITGHANTPNCVEAMRAGAWDYIEKNPADGKDPYKRLLDSICSAWEYRTKNPERGVPNPDNEWVHKHFDELVKQYPGKLVAVLYEKVVDSDTSFAELAKRIESKFPLARPTIISVPDSSKGDL